MTGKKHKQHTEDSKYVVMKSMEWNINGWKGDDKHKYRKIRRIKGEVIKYDQFILTETHLSDDEKEIAAFEQHFSEYYIYHVHAKEDSGRRLGVSIGIRKTMIEEKDIEIHRKTRRGREMDQNEAEGNIGGAIGHMGNIRAGKYREVPQRMADYSWEDDEENGRGDTSNSRRFQLYNGHETRQDSW